MVLSDEKSSRDAECGAGKCGAGKFGAAAGSPRINAGGDGRANIRRGSAKKRLAGKKAELWEPVVTRTKLADCVGRVESQCAAVEALSEVLKPVVEKCERLARHGKLCIKV